MKFKNTINTVTFEKLMKAQQANAERLAKFINCSTDERTYVDFLSNLTQALRDHRDVEVTTVGEVLYGNEEN